METKDKVITGIHKAADIFNSVYTSYEMKIELLKNVYNTKDYAKTCKESTKIYEAINILGENAVEEIPRRYQQQFLATLVKTIMSNPTREKLDTFFSENPILFDAFCLMYIHFQDDVISEKEKQAHEFMTKPLFKCVELMIN